MYVKGTRGEGQSSQNVNDKYGCLLANFNLIPAADALFNSYENVLPFDVASQSTPGLRKPRQTQPPYCSSVSATILASHREFHCFPGCTAQANRSP